MCETSIGSAHDNAGNKPVSTEITLVFAKFLPWSYKTPKKGNSMTFNLSWKPLLFLEVSLFLNFSFSCNDFFETVFF